MWSFSSSSLPPIRSAWLPPVVERPYGLPPYRAWPGPALEPLNLPKDFRDHVMNGLLWLCAANLRRRRMLPPDAAPEAAPLLCLEEHALAWLPLDGAPTWTTLWITWLLEAETRQMLRVLLAPAIAFDTVLIDQIAARRQAALGQRLARLHLLYQELERRLGADKALAALDAALAALMPAS
jgi:hypothetical protein